MRHEAAMEEKNVTKKELAEIIEKSPLTKKK